MWVVGEGLTCEVAREQTPEVREQAIQVSGRKKSIPVGGRKQKALLVKEKRGWCIWSM